MSRCFPVCQTLSVRISCLMWSDDTWNTCLGSRSMLGQNDNQVTVSRTVSNFYPSVLICYVPHSICLQWCGKHTPHSSHSSECATVTQNYNLLRHEHTWREGKQVNGSCHRQTKPGGSSFLLSNNVSSGAFVVWSFMLIPSGDVPKFTVWSYKQQERHVYQ